MEKQSDKGDWSVNKHIKNSISRFREGEKESEREGERKTETDSGS